MISCWILNRLGIVSTSFRTLTKLEPISYHFVNSIQKRMAFNYPKPRRDESMVEELYGHKVSFSRKKAFADLCPREQIKSGIFLLDQRSLSMDGRS